MDYHKATQNTPDYSDLFRATKELSEELCKLSAMSTDVAAANTAIKFDADRKKNALSQAVLVAYQEGSKSTSEATHRARASIQYTETMKKLAENYAKAQLVLSDYKTCAIKIDSLRSIISAQKTIAGIQ